MKSIHIVNHEKGFNNGILTKFSDKLFEFCSKNKDFTFTISGSPREDVDLNHHVNYLPYNTTFNLEKTKDTKNTLMITHIWEGYKLDRVKEQMQTADMGICMSSDTEHQLIDWGIDKEKLTTVLPAHDNNPRRHQVVAILTNVYPDGCKRAEMFTDLVRTLDKDKWAFRIMGSGWENILPEMVSNGFQIDYFHNFNYDIHQQILKSSDYLLYFGKDEGAMSVLDAKQEGLPVIAPNTGFHKDIEIDYVFDTQSELNTIFEQLTEKASYNPVAHLTWDNYAQQHIDIWKKLLN